MLWEELREEEFPKAIEESKGVCIIPIGCLEMHGQHLPVGTDNYQAEALATQAAELEPVMVFPTFKFGDVSCLVDWRGAIRIETTLILQLLENLCDEISRNGFKKILFLNNHGGNKVLLNYFQNHIVYRKKDYIVFQNFASSNTGIKDIWNTLKEKGMDFYPELLPEDVETIKIYMEEKKEDGHGGLEESCNMCAIRPELVRLDRMNVVSGLNQHNTDKFTKRHVHGGCFWNMDYPNSFEGHPPVGANERIGKMMLRLRAEKLAEALKVIKEDTFLQSWYEEHNKYYDGFEDK